MGAACSEEAARLECACAEQACEDCEASQAKQDWLQIKLAESAANVARLEAEQSSVAQELAARKAAELATEAERLRLEKQAAQNALKNKKSKKGTNWFKTSLRLLFFVFKLWLLAIILFTIGWYLMAAIHSCTAKKSQEKPKVSRRPTRIKFAFSGVDIPESEDLDLESGRNTIEQPEVEHPTIEV